MKTILIAVIFTLIGCGNDGSTNGTDSLDSSVGMDSPVSLSTPDTPGQSEGIIIDHTEPDSAVTVNDSGARDAGKDSGKDSGSTCHHR